MKDSGDSLGLFRAAVRVPEPAIDLAECALLIAQAEYAGLDRASYRLRLEEMGAEATRVCSGDLLGRIHRLNNLMFVRWGFHGNVKNYYDPRNSFLNDVLDRRTGIPITLALVYTEVGKHAGLDLVGIGMPGHFLVGFGRREDLFLDVFSAGAIITRGECVARLREMQPGVAFRPEFLAAVGPRQILSRMLNNLLGVYLRDSRFSKALEIVERILCLEPDEPEWLRQRGLLHGKLGSYSQAVRDLGTYLEKRPEATDSEEIMQQLSLLARIRGLVN